MCIYLLNLANKLRPPVTATLCSDTKIQSEPAQRWIASLVGEDVTENNYRLIREVSGRETSILPGHEPAVASHLWYSGIAVLWLEHGKGNHILHDQPALL